MMTAGVFLSTGIDYKIWLLLGLAAALGEVVLDPGRKAAETPS
jgi:hypothetical protein